VLEFLNLCFKLDTKIIPMFVSNIIPVEDVLVRPEITNVNFECDLSKCKGACCTLESEFGAPLQSDEIDKITRILDIVKEYLPKAHVDEIEENGFFEEKSGEKLTKSVDNKACVFVYFDGDIAKCGIEKAYLDGKVKFRKPISCHLFPIRISKFGGPVLRYEKFSECKPALLKGEKNKTSLVDFSKESLSRLYGNKWYSKLKEIIGK
jgi:hypothetical protein